MPAFRNARLSFTCTFPGCRRICATERGRKQHENAVHGAALPPEANEGNVPCYTFRYHDKLTGMLGQTL
jgi:hypothetical protein